MSLFFFFFNDTATTEIYTLSLHDALPISLARRAEAFRMNDNGWTGQIKQLAKYVEKTQRRRAPTDRKSTRLNSSHGYISYAVFCLKKKKNSANLLELHNKIVQTAT